MIKTDMTIQDYHSDKTIISSTGLKTAKRSTKDFINYVLTDGERKAHFDFGNAFELALMSDEEFQNECVVFVKPDPSKNMNGKENKEAFKAVIDTGKYIITQEDKMLIDSMVKSCKADPTIKKLITNVQYQQSLFWTDEETGLKCKTRPDICINKKNVIVDIKTCKDASPQGFSRDACNLDYPLQAVMQIEGAINSGLMPQVDNYFWLAVEKNEIGHAVLYEFQKDDLTYISDLYHFLLKDRCLKGLEAIKSGKLNELPSFGEQADNKHRILTFEMPLWYR